jgi:hypothetical protein
MQIILDVTGDMLYNTFYELVLFNAIRKNPIRKNHEIRKDYCYG